MARSASDEHVNKNLSDVGAGLAVAVASTILLKILSRRGRIVRTLALASAAAATKIVRNHLFANRAATTNSWSRDGHAVAGDAHV